VKKELFFKLSLLNGCMCRKEQKLTKINAHAMGVLLNRNIVRIGLSKVIPEYFHVFVAVEIDPSSCSTAFLAH